MRGFSLSLLILALVTVASGQIQQEKLKEPPTLKIESFQWSASGGDSLPGFTGGSGNGGIFPTISNWGVAQGGDGFGSTIPFVGTPFYCRATIKVKNAGRKTIRAVHLDYIFKDQTTGDEFLRYQFRTNTRIEPDDAKTLKHRIYQKAGKNRKAFLPLNPSLNVVLRSEAAEQVLVIRRIEYADGTAHQY